MLEDHSRLIQLTWQERVRGIARYHAMRCREDPDHTLASTAKELKRGIGRISEDLTIANWMRTYPRVEKFKNPRQALEYIKGKKKEMKVQDA